jgi:hypothetical protein
MAGILGGLPPGLQGWVLADQMNQQKQAGKMQELQGILGMQGALMQQQQAAQMGPLQMQLLKAQIAKAGRPDTPFGKIDPSKFTPESIAKFVASGGADFSVLDPLRKKDMTAAGEVVDLYNAAPGTKFNVTTPHQLWQQNTQFPTQTGIDLARLNQPVLSEAAGGWVPRPQVSIPGLLGGAPVAPRQPQGPIPSSMDGSPIQPLGGFITPPHPDENAPRMSPMQIPPAVQAQRDAEAARIRTAELQPNGGGMLPTSSVIPVPGMGGGRVPPGYERDPNKPGALRPIPGGPADIKAGEAGAKADLQVRRGLDRANVVIKKVDEALDKVGFFSTGVHGAALGIVPGTNAYNLEKTLDTIKANIGFEQLEQMRAASPTGGALGSIAVRELDFLQAAIASLDKGQSQAQLRSNLDAVKTHYTNWKRAVEMSRAGATSPAPGPDAIPTTNRNDLFKAADAILAGGR